MTRRAPLALLALLAAAPLAAQPAGAPAGADFRALWTPWAGINRDSIQAEARGVPAGPQAGAPDAGTPELGARVGDLVRAGDCAQGERLARAAGDFPLLEAVRAHCRSGAVQAVSRR